jgi:hypothetical protein
MRRGSRVAPCPAANTSFQSPIGEVLLANNQENGLNFTEHIKCAVRGLGCPARPSTRLQCPVQPLMVALICGNNQNRRDRFGVAHSRTAHRPYVSLRCGSQGGYVRHPRNRNSCRFELKWLRALL